MGGDNMVTKVVLALVQALMLMAVAFVGGQLWSLNNEMRTMQAELKHVEGQSARLDRLAENVNGLKRNEAVRDTQIIDLIKRSDIHREYLLKLGKDQGLP